MATTKTIINPSQIVLGNLELINNTCFIEGKAIKNPEKIGVAILNYLDKKNSKTIVNFDVYKKTLQQYLEDNYYRKTQERFKILKAVITINEPFTAKELILEIENEKLNLNINTVYNTLSLLFKAQIIINSPRCNETFKGQRFELNRNL